MLSPIEEMRFWTAIMRDHGEFILTSLAYNEPEAINQAMYYRDSFARLHEYSKVIAGVSKNHDSLSTLLRESTALLAAFVNFKKVLLQRLLGCQLNTSLPPTFYNHMINEAIEFCKAMFIIQNNAAENPVCKNIDLHRKWLPDTAGHAATIACGLDPAEKLLKKQAMDFEEVFNKLGKKADELGIMLMRTCLSNGVLAELNKEVKMHLEDFLCYLDKIRILTAECKVLSVIKPLMPFHMMREGIYYLDNIKAVEAEIAGLKESAAEAKKTVAGAAAKAGAEAAAKDAEGAEKVKNRVFFK